LVGKKGHISSEMWPFSFQMKSNFCEIKVRYRNIDRIVPIKARVSGSFSYVLIFYREAGNVDPNNLD